MTRSTSIPVSNLVTTTHSWATSGLIDATSNLNGSRVYLFSGTLDSVIKTPVMDDLKTYYQSYMPIANIAYKKDLASEHAMVTEDYGSNCSVKGAPYINDCNYDLAGEILKHVYGPLNPRNTGYNRWTDTNNMVVLYPQTSLAATNSCWDWWGYDSANYAKKSGPQMAALKAMVDQLTSGTAPGYYIVKTCP